MCGNNNTFVRKRWDPKLTLSGAYFLRCSKQKPEKRRPNRYLSCSRDPLLRLEVSVRQGSAHSCRVPQLCHVLLSGPSYPPASCLLMAPGPFIFRVLGLDPGETIHEKLLTTCSSSFHVLRLLI